MRILMTQTIAFPSLADDVQKLPARGAARERQLHRLIDLHAAAEAAAALKAAAAREPDGVLAAVLEAAGAVLVGADEGARDRLREAVASRELLSFLTDWARELREVASLWPDTGACTVATALKLWLWTMNHFRAEAAPRAVDELAEALCPLLAARCFALDVTANASAQVALRSDLCHVYAAHVSAAAATLCAELVFGYRRHLVWDAEGCAACYAADDVDELEAVMPGIATGARTTIDFIEADGSHPAKRGPCANFNGLETFMKLRNRLDGCLTGARMAKDRAAAAIGGRG
jgi:hypothetical protein